MVKGLSRPLRGGLQTAPNQLEREDARRPALPAEDASQWAARESRPVADSVQALVGELWETELAGQAPHR